MALAPRSRDRHHPHPSVFNVQNSGTLLLTAIEEEIIGLNSHGFSSGISISRQKASLVFQASIRQERPVEYEERPSASMTGRYVSIHSHFSTHLVRSRGREIWVTPTWRRTGKRGLSHQMGTNIFPFTEAKMLRPQWGKCLGP